jgi:uncharacterized protein with PhoU and TrkA domain
LLSIKNPREIANKLADLKNISELMISLAYTSLFLNSKDLAKEVQMLENRIDKMQIEFELLVLSSEFKPEEAKNFLGLIRLAEVTERIADAGSKIAEVVLRGLKPHPVLKLVIEEAEETVSRIQIAKLSLLVGKTLREAQIPERTGMWVLVIRRNGKWLRPKPETVMQHNDVLVASGYAEGEADFERLALGSG